MFTTPAEDAEEIAAAMALSVTREGGWRSGAAYLLFACCDRRMCMRMRCKVNGRLEGILRFREEEGDKLLTWI